ncbi:DUF748 domain-containing protein [Bdellovibrio svalbardensis]|uniref:DUF748 domain-containing protein n=1 Tax=Bdellovibrio svalbardensis TaxID=2972972 RepID=A0ABT6DJ88_9BACT|nr:DUF748 domain-containing protein [Bdellovibrio svalbardensis]MDG0816290.1 DUF748 domain-containing protein [Bdellovibrio svalbardensis]
MQIKEIKFQTVPMSLRVQEVNLLKPRTEIVLRKDGTLNFKDFMRSSRAASGSPPSSGGAPKSEEGASSSFDYLVNKVTISDGLLDYTDQQIRPRFSSHIHGLEGQIGPVSVNLMDKMNVTLAGLVEAYGKFEGKGYFIPGIKTPSLNLDMRFHNIELTTFTPYSGKFAGYEISKGKLFLDINYTLVNNQIKGKNQVLLDQFTLGNKIESENSTHWPVKLALALMKDRNGQIKFKLPVEGDVHSPSFSWGNLIWTAIKNMVINIVAAPFDFIASLVGGGPELQTLLFEPGTSSLQQGETEKFQKIARILEERPGLAMEIKGQYQDLDAEVLQHNNINRNLEPFLKKNKGDRPAALRAMAQSIFKKEDFNNLVTTYQAAHGVDEIGLAQELENKLAATVVVSDDELKALALSRGKVVMAGLSVQKVNLERLYLLAGTRAEKGKPSQVLLNLKER